jgi:hypothetical protein
MASAATTEETGAGSPASVGGNDFSSNKTESAGSPRSPIGMSPLGKGFESLVPPNEEESFSMNYMKSRIGELELDPEDTGFLTDATFLRFARARQGNPLLAFSMLHACCQWRRTYKPYAIEYAQVEGILRMGTVFHSGYCREGRPVFYMSPGSKNTYPAEKREQLIVYLMEETSRNGYEQVTWVFDWSQFGNRGKDEESTKTREKVTKVLQDYYPERLGSLYFVDVPWYFSFLYAIASLFIDGKTKKKIHIIKNKEVVKYIEPRYLMKQFAGGEADPPVQRMSEEEHDRHAREDLEKHGSPPPAVVLPSETSPSPDGSK